MRILSITAQKPHSTGSGIYLTELVRWFHEAGHKQAVIAGVGADDRAAGIYRSMTTQTPAHPICSAADPEVPLLQSPDFPAEVPIYPVHFETEDLPYPITGMSDEMPYKSTRYCDLTEEMQLQFLHAFEAQAERAVAAFQPDLVICHHLYFLTAMIRERFPQHRIIGLCHGSDLRQLHKNPMRREQIIRSIQKLDLITALQEEQREELISYLALSPKQVSVLGAGYNSRIFHRQEGAVQNGAGTGAPVRLLFAGKLSEKKGVMSLLRAMRELKRLSDGVQGETPLSFTLTLAGGYGNESEYQEILRLADLSPYPVIFAGKLSQEALAERMNQSDVFVLPSFYEGLALVLIEAMACGMHDVASDLPGIRAWMNQHLPGNGIRFVTAPRMQNADEPVPETLPAFERRLAEAIYESARAFSAERRDVLSGNAALQEALMQMSWKGVAERLLRFPETLV